MADDPGASASFKVPWIVASLGASAAGIYFLSGVFPVSAHAGDWPGPYVGAAFGLELAGMAAFAGMLLASRAWRSPASSRMRWCPLAVSVAVYVAVGVSFPWVGFEPFCGSEGNALAGLPPPKRPLFGSPCDRLIVGEYVLPLLIIAALVLWQIRRGKRAACGTSGAAQASGQA